MTSDGTSRKLRRFRNQGGGLSEQQEKKLQSTDEQVGRLTEQLEALEEKVARIEANVDALLIRFGLRKET